MSTLRDNDKTNELNNLLYLCLKINGYLPPTSEKEIFDEIDEIMKMDIPVPEKIKSNSFFDTNSQTKPRILQMPTQMNKNQISMAAREGVDELTEKEIEDLLDKLSKR